ncbi:hypothetical protein [Streptomyces sp. URMC 129]|uniref:hypothetical protein n=1 Tax=Streptomyces sp. URMC 129 TaxID=3423407 RepID=UPI003F1DB000
MSDDLVCDGHDPAGRNSGDNRDGTRPETVLTGVGPVRLRLLRSEDRGRAA